MNQSTESGKEWYAPVAKIGDDLAGEAFEAALKRFASVFTEDKRKIATANSTTSLQDLQDIVTKARARYEASHKNEAKRKWLGKIASRLHHYGTIMDVLVQHHPEYVALAWGAMKFLFTTFLNHDAVVSSLAKALSQIADELPRVDLSIMLYPTERMKQAVMELYAYIIRFFIRALDWYQESSLMHVLHSITRPTELRYKDLISNISDCSRRINQLASLGEQAEQRDMHKKIDRLASLAEQAEQRDMRKKIDRLASLGEQAEQRDMHKKIEVVVTVVMEMKEQMATYQSLNAAATLNTNQRLSDLQLSNIMSHLSNVPLANLGDSFRYHVLMRNRRDLTFKAKVADPFWHSPKLQAWSRAQHSSLSMVTGTFQSRYEMRDFCVNVIEELHRAQIAVFWVMTMSGDGTTMQSISTVDLLKHLILQALRQRSAPQTEKSMALSCTKVQSLCTEREWFQLLESVLADFPSDVYLVIDLEAITSKFLPPPSTFSWPSAFHSLFESLSTRGIKTRVKVLLISYGSSRQQQPAPTHFFHGEVLVASSPRGITKHRARAGARNRVLPLFHRGVYASANY